MIVLRVIAGLVVALIGAVTLAFMLQKHPETKFRAYFDKARFAQGVSAHFARSEARFDDITAGAEKRVIWAGAPETRTEWSVLYVHGFSATSEEIRPVPDLVAQALGANLVYTRLQGHGRGSAAMAEGTVDGWMNDMAEGLAAAEAVGERVILIGTSTGGTLVAAAAASPASMDNVAGVVLVSPNFGVNTPMAGLLTWPFVDVWGPWIAGETLGFEAKNAQHEKFWTTSYPTVATIPMAQLVRGVVAQDQKNTLVPALFWYSQKDKVVRSDITDKIAATWGRGYVRSVTVVHPTLTERDDAYAHVVGGDTLSPGQTEAMSTGILEWINGL